MKQYLMARAGRAGPEDLGERMPELAPLRSKVIAVFGLGCLGGPSALEFARAGIGELRILDHDTVDPATVQRWPFGLQAAGLHKANVISDAIARDYPFTSVRPFLQRVGAVRSADDKGRSQADIIAEIVEGASLVYDATAEIGVQQYLADVATGAGLPYVGVHATRGGWGGEVVRIVPGKTQGCWMCYQHAVNDNTIVAAPQDQSDDIQPAGCADPTFTGANFDLVQIALAAVRLAVSTLCMEHDGGYPASEWDVLTMALRNCDGQLIVPRFEGYVLSRHSNCPDCTRT